MLFQMVRTILEGAGCSFFTGCGTGAGAGCGCLGGEGGSSLAGDALQQKHELILPNKLGQRLLNHDGSTSRPSSTHAHTTVLIQDTHVATLLRRESKAACPTLFLADSNKCS